MNYVSSSAAEIYRAGGFYDLTTLREEWANKPLAGIRTLSELFPPFSYERKLPSRVVADERFCAELLTRYHDINQAYNTGAASVLVELSNSILARNVIYINQDGERHILHETHRPPDRADSPLLDSNASISAYPVDANSLYLFVGSVGSFNYGHWLIDDMARLQAFHALQKEFPKQRIVVLLPSYCSLRKRTLLDRWNRTRLAAVRNFLKGTRHFEVEFADASRAYSFERLFYATPISYHPVLKSPDALALLVESFTRPPGFFRWHKPVRRLFVLRRGMRGRVLKNTDALRDLAEKQGFTAIDPESMSIAQQAATFMAAEVVAGVMGAAMTNTLFCRPGTRVIHLAPTGWTEPFYWDLAALRNHLYFACYGPTLPTVGPAHMTTFEMPESIFSRLLLELN